MGFYWYLQKVPGGGWRDIRYRYARGDTVRVISGTFDGLWGTVDSVVCQKSYDYPDEGRAVSWTYLPKGPFGSQKGLSGPSAISEFSFRVAQP